MAEAAAPARIPGSRAEAGATWIAAGLALALRLSIAARLPIIEVDGAYWCGLARAFTRADWSHAFHTAWPPLYPALVAVAERLTGGDGLLPAHLEWSARLVSAIAGALLVFPLGVIARRLLPRPWPGAVLLLAAVHPRLIEYSAAALSESVFMLALVSGLAALAVTIPHGDRPRRPAPWAAAGGACFGLAFLTRPEALPLGLGVGAVAWLAAKADGRRVGPPFLLALAVVALPWVGFVHDRTGSWSLGEKGTYNFWRAHREAHARHFPPPVALPQRVNRSPEIAPAARPGEVRPLELLRREPGAVLGRTARQLVTLVGSTYPVAIGWPITVLAVAGLLFVRAGPWWLVCAPLAIAPLLIAPFSVDRRFLVPMTPLAIPLAAAALARLARRGWAWAPALTTFALVAGLLLYSLGIPLRADRAPEQRRAGEWLATRTPAPVVMARKPWVAFYAGGSIADLPDGSPDSILADARRTGVDAVVVDARAARGDRPQLAAWLDPGRLPGGWVALRRWKGPDPVVLLAPEGPPR